jgi:hypothetical protein
VAIAGGNVKDLTSNSNRVTPEMQQLLGSLSRGNKIYIEDITVKMPDGSTTPIPSSISLKVQ